MIYQKNKNNIRQISIVASFVLFFIFILAFPVASGKIYYSLGKVVDKVFKKTKDVENAIIDIPLSKNELIKENKRLYSNLLEAEIMVSILKEKQITSNKSNIEAEIVSKGELPFSSEFVVNKGSIEGVSLGDLVFTDTQVYLGVVSNVFKKESIVSLSTKHGRLTEAFLSETNLGVTLEGVGSQSFMFKLPKEEVVKENSPIFYSKDSSFVLATVKEIVVDDKYPYKTIYANIPLNINYISKVFIKKSNE